jgi:hypothetical protein
VALTHDSLIGPVSPAGRIHAATVGSGFRVTEEGPVADLGDDARLRPVPRDFLERVSAPHSFWSLVQGVEAFVASISLVTTRESRTGSLAGRGALAELRPRMEVAQALALLGPPELWLRRETGSLMLYRTRDQRAFSLYLGVPPPAAALVPVPGVGNLHFRYASDSDRARKLLLLFDQQDLLIAAIASEEP